MPRDTAGPSPVEMGIKVTAGGPVEADMDVPDQKTSEPERGENRSEIIDEVEERLEEINVGSYTMDKEHGGGSGEDLFDAPKNLDEVLREIGDMIDLSIAENWPRERFTQEISQIKVVFDLDYYKRNYDDFQGFRPAEEQLGNFSVLVEDITAKVYNE